MIWLAAGVVLFFVLTPKKRAPRERVPDSGHSRGDFAGTTNPLGLRVAPSLPQEQGIDSIQASRVQLRRSWR